MKQAFQPSGSGPSKISGPSCLPAPFHPEDIIESAPSGIVVANTKDTIIYLNAEAENILGVKASSVVGGHVSTLIGSPADLHETCPSNRSVIIHKHGSRKLLISESPALSNEETVGKIYTIHDITDVDGDEIRDARDLNCKLESLIEGSYDGMIFTDSEKILKVNSSFSRISGLKKENIEGQRLSHLTDSPHVCLQSINEVFHLVRREKKSVTIMRKMHQGNEIYITGTPAMCNGKVTHVTVIIRDVTELQRLQEQVSRLAALYLSRPEENQTSKLLGDHMIVESPAMRRLIDLTVRVSQVDSVVLIYGESGTGKEVLARLIHSLSSRNKGPFISINCGAIPENLLESELFGYEKGSFTGAWRDGKPGLFEIANNGTIFLDEIGEMPLNLQVKLLKVLQDKELYRLGGLKPIKFDVRVIAVTNRNLRDMVKEGKFREDLFYRLYVIPIEVPPLRERREDIFPIAWHYLRQYNQKYKQSKTFSPELVGIMESYTWPGNVRELQNVVERIVVTCETEIVKPEHLPQSVCQGYIASGKADGTKQESVMAPLSKAKEDVERGMLVQALTARRTTREIAGLLGIDHSTVVRKIRKYGLKCTSRQKIP